MDYWYISHNFWKVLIKGWLRFSGRPTYFQDQIKTDVDVIVLPKLRPVEDILTAVNIDGVVFRIFCQCEISE